MLTLNRISVLILIVISSAPAPSTILGGEQLARLEWVRSPQQARSQQTLERLLDAAESLMIEKGFENTTVSEIAKAGKSSVGAFYARFGDKENLLRCVFERFAHEAEATVDAALRTERWDGVPFHLVLREAMRFMVGVFRQRAKLISVFTIQSQRDPGTYAFGDRVGELIVDRALAMLRERGEKVGHPDPERAVRFCVWTVLSSLEAWCFHSSSLEAWFDLNEVAEGLTHMTLSYLGMEVA